jgi:3-oxoacyl-[acyl-carrier protein] reductase
MVLDDTLTDKHALVCGASAGIGRATALALATQGARVSVLARRAERLEELLPELRQAGAPEARKVVADLDRRHEAVARVSELIEQHGAVHILVNNSGGPPSGALLEADPGAFEEAFGRLVLAAHLLTRAVLPGMKAAGYGRIINIISISVREPIPGLGVSNTIRGAMAAWAKSAARELPPGLTINNILPGYTDTERLTELRQAIAQRTGLPEEEVVAGWLAHVPEGRLGRAEEIGAAAAFLASPAASFVRGVSLPVDGGRLFAL